MKKYLGSSYVFVLVIIASVFMMISSALAISNYQKILAEERKKNSNNYYLALAGAEKFLDLINNNLKKELNNIKKQTTDIILSNNLEEIVYYKVDSLDNKYGGNFHLKEKNNSGVEGAKDVFYKNTFVKVMNNYTNEYLKRDFFKSANKYSFKYITQLDKEDFSRHETVVNIDYIATNPIKYNVYSTDTNLETNNYVVVEGVLGYNTINSDEIIKEDYTFSNILPWFEYPLYIFGELIIDETTNQNGYSGKYIEKSEGEFSDIINNLVILEDSTWSIDYPVIYKDETLLDIDVSSFYIDDKPVPIIIINRNENGVVNINVTDPNKNHFEGIIVSFGDININGDLYLYGNIFSKKNVNLQNSALNLTKDTEIIFKVNFEKINDKRKILDKFNITNFNSLLDYSTNKIITEKILKNAKLLLKSVIINNNEIKYTYYSLKQSDQ